MSNLKPCPCCASLFAEMKADYEAHLLDGRKRNERLQRRVTQLEPVDAALRAKMTRLRRKPILRLPDHKEPTA